MLADDDAMVVAIDPSSDMLGDVMKRLRTTAGLSQRQLAEKLKVSPQYINDLERHRRLGSVEIVQAICDVFAAHREWRRLIHCVAARGRGWEVGASMLVADDDAMVVAIDPSSDMLGDVMKRLRATAGLSQRQLAKKMNVSHGNIANLERHRCPGSVEIVQKICDVFAAHREWRQLIHRVAARGHGWEV